MRILTVNAGSASLKLALFDVQGEQWLRLKYVNRAAKMDEYAGIMAEVVAKFAGAVDAVVHRFVHGGTQFSRPVVISAQVEVALGSLASLAPLHNPPALQGIRIVRELLGAAVTHIAVFDTAFFADLPAVAITYALPKTLSAQFGLRRFGFHGIAHEARWRRWSELAGDSLPTSRVISLHLGGGCSAAAILGGKAQDSSMGFSPLDGLVMATRSGDIDASALMHVLKSGQYSVDELERLLNKESGLLGLSAHSGDMRALLDSERQEDQFAIDVFIFRVRKYIGAYAAVLGGLDAILIGGGIGEFQPSVRARIFENMAWLGIEFDPPKNARVVNGEASLSAEGSAVSVWLIPTDEERALAERAVQLMLLIQDGDQYD